MTTPGEPDAFALARHALPLVGIIGAEIDASGPITFARFMELALGHPQHGYYARTDLRWGAPGDYETSPQVHPVFGYLWGQQIAECWERLGRPERFHLIEPGAGSGRFAADILTYLRTSAPACFAATRPVLLDGHEARQAEQAATLAEAGLHAEHRSVAEWIGDDAAPVTGVMISNEFFDALPVHLISSDETASETVPEPALREWLVTRGSGAAAAFELIRADTVTDTVTDAGADTVADAAATPPLTAIEAQLRAVGVWPAVGTRVEVSPAVPEVMRGLAARLDRGYLLTLDYGYEAAELYAPWRRNGTLMAFRDHSPQPDPLAEPGRLDLTAHVDFTALRLAATGWEAAPLVAQAEALIALGIGEHLAAVHGRMAADPLAYAEARRAVDTLLEPAGLGRVRLLALARGAPLDGLTCLRGAHD